MYQFNNILNLTSKYTYIALPNVYIPLIISFTPSPTEQFESGKKLKNNHLYIPP